jgi:hypothetical protein
LPEVAVEVVVRSRLFPRILKKFLPRAVIMPATRYDSFVLNQTQNLQFRIAEGTAYLIEMQSDGQCVNHAPSFRTKCGRNAYVYSTFLFCFD